DHALAAEIAEGVDGLQHCGSFGSGSNGSGPATGRARHQRSPPVADPAGGRPAGSGTVRVVRATTRRSEGLADELRELDQAAGEAPLVVVPGEDLDLVADDLGQLTVDDRGVRIPLDVLGDDRVLGVSHDA